jgi:hypothetical protein
MYNYLRKIQLNNLFINAKILITIYRKLRFIFAINLVFFMKTDCSPTDICYVHKFIIIESTHVWNNYC